MSNEAVKKVIYFFFSTDIVFNNSIRHKTPMLHRLTQTHMHISMPNIAKAKRLTIFQVIISQYRSSAICRSILSNSFTTNTNKFQIMMFYQIPGYHIECAKLSTDDNHNRKEQ